MNAANSEQSAPGERLAAAARQLMRRAALRMLDSSEELASRLFEFAEQLAAAFELTPCYPILEIQQTFSRKAFEYWMRGARLLVSTL